MALRIPSVHLRVERGETSELGELRGEALGLALLVLIALDVILGGEGSTNGELDLTPLRVSCFLGCATVLIVGAAVDTRFHALFRRRSSTLVGTCLTLAGSALAVAGISLLGSAGAPLGLVAGTCLGAGLALLVFLWGIAFGRLDLGDISLNAVVGVAVGILAYVLVASRMPVPWGHAVVGALQAAHIVLLRNRVTDALPDPDMREAPYFSELQIKRASFAAKIIPTLLCLGVVLGNVVLHAEFVMKPSAGMRGEVATVVAVLLGSLLVLGACVVARRREQTFAHAFRTMIPLVAVLILALVLSQAAALSVPSASVLTSFVIVATMCWAYLGSLSQGFRLSPVFVFGLGVGSMALGFLLASPLNLVLQPLVDDVLPQPAFGLTVCLLCLVIATGLFPRRDDIMAIVVRSYQPSELWGTDDGETDAEAAGLAGDGGRGHSAGDAGATSGTGLRAGMGGAAGADGPGAGWDASVGTAFGGTGPSGARLPRSHAGTPYGHASALAGGEPRGRAGGAGTQAGGSGAGMGPSVGAGARAAGGMQATGAGGAGGEADASVGTGLAGGTGGAGEGDEVRKGRFVRRCEYVADTFPLSRRETDVLFLLAKGRNVSFICEQLYISEGTAKTHVNHVYKKLGVHSRQELIKLIDEFDA